MTVKNVLEDKLMIVNPIFLEEANRLELNLNEFLFLLYFINEIDKTFDIKKLADSLKLTESQVLEAMNSLIKKKLIIIESAKNSLGKITEQVNLDYFYSNIEENVKKNSTEQKNVTIYTIFEKEFGRPISSMEYEIIKAWLEKDFSEELILGALKEAVYNGVTNLRYIDKILYEWQKKGFKSLTDVNNHITKRNKEKEVKKELFDYNWLEDENN